MRIFFYLLALIVTVGFAQSGNAQTVVASDDFDNPVNLQSFNNPFIGAFSSPGDGFETYNFGTSATIPFQLVDDSQNSSDNLGIIPTEYPDGSWFGATDLVNSSNSGGEASATWVFNIAGASNLSISIDMGAMGDFEASNDAFNFFVSIDGGAEQQVFTSTVNEEGSLTYTLSDGTMNTLNDPLTMNGITLNNVLQTVTASINGTGSSLTLIFRATTDGGSEGFAFDNIVIEGDNEGGEPTEGCNELFISEVVEGSSNNKAVEIYNPTMGTVNLNNDNYQLATYHNGNSDLNDPTTLVSLDGEIASGDVFVLAQSSATSELLALADQITGVGWFNGNDVIVLWKGGLEGTIVDVVGQLGNSSNFNQNQTIRRNSNVTSGDTNPDDAFTTTAEFAVFEQNTFSGIGSHMSDCIMIECTITSITLGKFTECNDNETISTEDDFFTTDVTVEFMGAPSTGTLDLSGDAMESVDVSSLDGNSYTFSNVMLPSDGGTIAISASFSDEAACSFTNSNAGTAPDACSIIPACSRPFFSEYIEGSSLNKCVEIYNPTDFDIDLTEEEFVVSVFFNGSTSAGTTIVLEGTLKSGDVFVVCDDGADAEILALADQTTRSSLWNGDDAIVLENFEGVLDVIGQVGFDPGSRYEANGVSTRDATLRRIRTVQAGDNIATDAFDPSAEFIARDINNFDNLGFHETACQDSGLPIGLTPNFIGCGSGSIEENGGTFTLESDCFDPNLGSDDLTFVNQELCGDGMVEARVLSLDPTGYAGVMFRASASNEAQHVWLQFRGNDFFRSIVQLRQFEGANSMSRLRSRFGAAWMRIVRTGDFFKFYVSRNGMQWQLIDQLFIDMPDCMLAGFAIHSRVDFTNASVTFDNFSVTGSENLNLVQENNAEAQQLGTKEGAAANSAPKLSLADFTKVGVSIYPNPATTNLTVQISNWIDNEALINITDVNGKVLFSDRFERNGNTVDLNIKDLAEGMYFIHIETGSEVQTQRFVKTTK